ncbi:MAG: DeoR family transcriptional regulator, partial [Alicyclobacillus herbarius]|uniref:DeoR family transcriptional regulator n=1 Tax=Alicyclobacillus herbarius TaxID=122960 RepID=UPI002356FA49
MTFWEGRLMVLGEMRQQKLKEILLREGSVRIADLKERFGVSEETVRRDLKKLESEGLARRTHGGAILVEPVPETIITSAC